MIKIDQTKLNAKSIPLKVLRTILPDIRSKKKSDFISELEKRDIDKLKAMADYYSSCKEKSAFFFKPLKGHSISEVNVIIKNLSGKKHFDKKDDIIYEVNVPSYDENKKEIYITVKIYSDVRVFYGNEPEPNDLRPFKKEHRKGFKLFIVVYPEDEIVEIRTRNEERSLFGSYILSKELFDKKESFSKVTFSKKEQSIIDKNIRCKKASILNLNFNGADTIHILGEDVERTVEAFKTAGIDFEKMRGAVITWEKTECDTQPIIFHKNGMISYKKFGSIYPIISAAMK